MAPLKINHGTQMTQIKQIFADQIIGNHKNQRHQRSIGIHSKFRLLKVSVCEDADRGVRATGNNKIITMKKIIAIILVFIATSSLAQQKETFDLATYTVPQGWKKVDGGNGVIGYAITNNLTGTYCQIAIYKSMGTMGNAQLDFDTEWNDLIVKPYKPTAKPEMVPGVTEEGWEAKAGVAPFDYSGGKSIAMLVTMSGYATRMSIVILTNTEDYQTEIENFLGSVDLKKPETTTSGQTGISQQTTPITNDDKNSILGTWGMNASTPYRSGTEGIAGYTIRQYTFNANGTYHFYIKTFRYSFNKLLLTRETGTYQISGSNLTVIPQKSEIEAWSKKDGTDKWGTLLSTQSKALEKVTYQFTTIISLAYRNGT